MFGRIAITAVVSALLCGMLVSAATAETSRIYVNGECGDDAWSGKYSQCSGPDGYKRTIQAALDAIGDGGTIMVTAGTYSGEGNRDLDFNGKAVQLTGYDCTIDCDATGADEHRAFHFHSGETETSVVQGFRITDGQHWKGGAVFCTNSSPKFVDCTFQGNEATDDDTGGGAMYNENSSPTLEGCMFTENLAMPSASYGGAITNEGSSPTLRDCTFTGNEAWAGGGIYNTDNSNPVLENCTFLNNQAVRGAGIGNSGSSPTLSRCTFTGNSASYYGGGMNNTSESNPTLTHCTFMSNSAIDGGGMANWSSSPAVINCLFAANSAAMDGGAVCNDASFTQLINCTIYANASPYGGGIAAYDRSDVSVSNCILWGNTPHQADMDAGCLSIVYSCIQGGWTGAGNVGGDPLLADADGPDNILGTEDDDFSILAGSACIDAGNNSAAPPTLLTDLAYLRRFADDLDTPDTGSGPAPIIDMGAYESQGDVPEDGVIYVDDDAAGANNGSDWASAFNNLQDALAAASGEYEIRVAQGTYKPDQGVGITPYDREATFQLKDNVTIKGGYAGLGEPVPDTRDIEQYPTILTGDLAGDDGPDCTECSENSYHVVTGTDAEEAILDGLTITAGNANGSYPHNNGGGIIIDYTGGSPTLTDCTISNSHADSGGGGLYVSRNAVVAVTRCTFIGNTSSYTGGAFYNYKGEEIQLYFCTFRGNSASHGGALSNFLGSISIVNCTFTGNSASDYSGGQGGALHHWGNSASDYFALVNSTIVGNLASGLGGPGQGGGLLVQDEMGRVENCIFWNNSDADGQDESAQIHDIGGESVLSNCCIQGFTGGGTANIADDPLMLDPDGPDNIFGTEDDNLRLLAGSPCLNAGDNALVPESLTKDMDGEPRIENGFVDIGAYEGASPGIIISPQSLTVPEGGTATFTVALSTDPLGTMGVELTHYSGDEDIQIESAQNLPFNSANYDQPQTVVLRAAADLDLVNGSALFHITADGYFTAGLTATEIDNESSAVLYVDASAPVPGTGASWAAAFPSLQDALNTVVEYPQFNEIRVAQGTYKPDQGIGITPGSRDATFQLINNVTVKGGYAGLAEPDPDARDIAAYPTILSGDLDGNDIYLADPADLLDEATRAENSRNIVTATDCDRTAVIDGFTVTGGNADGPAEARKYGGGIYNGNPTVSNCTIIGNSADTGGGGISFYYAVHEEGGLLTGCTVAGNAAPSGGGIRGCAEITNCVINGNAATAYIAGGIYFGSSCETTITDTVISNNSAATHGGGAYVGASESNVVFIRCTFVGNFAAENGGALSVDGCTCASNALLDRCTIIGNSTDGGGGAIYTYGYSFTSLSSCLLVGNSAAADGGAICDGGEYDDGGSSIINCTFAHNTAAGYGGAVKFGGYTRRGRFLANSILWYNADSTGQTGASSQVTGGETESLTMEYCSIQNKTSGGIQIIDDNPLFLDADGPDDLAGNEDDNLRLEPDSPCINQGNNDHVQPDGNDLDGNSRILEGRVDMGAYESSHPGEQARYDIIDLGTLGGEESMAYAINNYGQIVGWARIYTNSMNACMFDFRNPANNIDLDPYGGTASGAHAINIHGVPVGTARQTQTGPFHATIFNPSDPGDNVFLHGPEALEGSAGSINDLGQIVGWEQLPSRDYKATLFDPSGAGDNLDLAAGGLSNPNGLDESVARSINNEGQIVGYAHTGTTSIHARAVLFDATGAGDNTILTPDEDDEGKAHSINDAGQIVGWSSKTGGAALFNQTDPGNNLALGALPGATDSEAFSINNRGQIVGSVEFWEEGISTYNHAAIFDPTGGGDNRDLNELIDYNTGWELSKAYGINDAGWIVGYGRYTQGSTRGFLLIPKGQSPTLTAHWKLDESEGDTAEDSAGDNDGTLHGDPLWLPNEGRVEGALLFDGDDDYVDCGDSSDFDITGQITVAAWVNISAVNMDWQTVIAKGDSAWRLSTAEDEYRYHFAVTGGPPWNYINGDIEVEPAEWHHVCGTYDGANLRLYIDCVEDPAGPVGELNGTTVDDYAVYIGENQERPGRHWDGLIDDLRIYNYALTPAEISQLCKIDVLYVDKDARGLNNGCCWGDAFQCLQDALAAATDGTEIRVAQGTYHPDCGEGIASGDREATFSLRNGVTVNGGYAGHGEPEPNARSISQYPTILSGDLLGNDNPDADPLYYYDDSTRVDNSHHVVTGTGTDATAVLDGCTITAGQPESYGRGGGMYNEAGSPTLVDCIFTRNAAEMGGGIYNTAQSSPSLTRCTFTGNVIYCDYEGAAMANTDQSSPCLTDCIFTHNVGHGAVIYNCDDSSPILTGCVLSDNVVWMGAVYNYNNSNPVLSHCVFVGNSCSGILNDNSNPVLFNCTFAHNEYYNGAGMNNWNSSPTVTNCTFTGNTAHNKGGGIHTVGDSHPIVTNCTFTGNTAQNKGGGIYTGGDSHPIVTNCIFWHNTSGESAGQELYTEYYDGYAASITVSFSSIEGGLDGIFVDTQSMLNFGPGNIAQDPCFVDPANGDYHLKSLGWRWDSVYEEWTFDRETSRCIDAGNPGSPLLDEPLTVPGDPNNDYGQNLRINMGVYGGTAEASMPPLGWALLADVNNDGIADFRDFAYAGMDWQLTAPQQPCDLDRNNAVGPTDLDLFADDWLRETTWRE